MNTSDFYYDLPQSLIAQTPAQPRDASRMMVVPAQGAIEHRHFYDVIDYLDEKDVLVVNNTKVIPARLLGETESGGAMEFLLLRRIDADRWETLVKPGKKARIGREIRFGGGLLRARVESVTPDGGRIVRFLYEGVFEQLLDQLGQMPLPLYITEKLEDPSRYQTVYAAQEGSAAAPTAGLHFTQALLDRIRAKGVDIVPVLLHVGLGTFRPVKAQRVEEHHMHSEYYEITPDAAARINAARARGGRIVCVGTTSVRTLESAAKDGIVQPGSGWTDIFITPGYRFNCVDALITNFHLPESTLLMLVSALMGTQRMLEAYRLAVAMQYRFFSFGDAMLLLAQPEKA
jgi:S-adenosylmethionine:tRNA ribosyltransferase-isomerase